MNTHKGDSPSTSELGSLPEWSFMKYDAIQFDGLEKAVIGVGNQYTKAPLLIYSASRIIDILMERDGMDYEEAVEFFEFNIAGLWAGVGTPIILTDLEDTDFPQWRINTMERPDAGEVRTSGLVTPRILMPVDGPLEEKKDGP